MFRILNFIVRIMGRVLSRFLVKKDYAEGGPKSNMTGVLIKRGNLDIETNMHRGKMM